jgi:hypothetical protein
MIRSLTSSRKAARKLIGCGSFFRLPKRQTAICSPKLWINSIAAKPTVERWSFYGRKTKFPASIQGPLWQTLFLKRLKAAEPHLFLVSRGRCGREQRLYGSDGKVPSSVEAAMSGWQEEKAERNRQALARLSKRLPTIYPPAVLARALTRPFIPPTPRVAIDSYWRAHPIRADRLARALAARSGAPAGWRWQLVSPACWADHRGASILM